MWTPFIIHTQKKIMGPTCHIPSLSFLLPLFLFLSNLHFGAGSRPVATQPRLPWRVALAPPDGPGGPQGDDHGQRRCRRCEAVRSPATQTPSDSPYSFGSRLRRVAAQPHRRLPPPPRPGLASAAPVFSHQLGIEVEAARRCRRRCPWSPRPPPPPVACLQACGDGSRNKASSHLNGEEEGCGSGKCG